MINLPHVRPDFEIGGWALEIPMNMFVGLAIFEAGSYRGKRWNQLLYLRDLRKLCNLHRIHCEPVFDVWTQRDGRNPMISHNVRAVVLLDFEQPAFQQCAKNGTTTKPWKSAKREKHIFCVPWQKQFSYVPRMTNKSLLFCAAIFTKPVVV